MKKKGTLKRIQHTFLCIENYSNLSDWIEELNASRYPSEFTVLKEPLLGNSRKLILEAFVEFSEQ